MALQYRTKGFVYKRRDRGEADRIFTVFSYDFGKIDIWARGIRKIDSKLKSGIDIFSLSDIEFVQGRKKTLTDAVIINKFGGIINNPEKFSTAKKICKILDDFVRGEEHDKEIFDLITETFEKLNNYNLQVTSCNLIFIYFLWNFFAILGYGPQLLNCAHCHGNLKESELYFSDKEGGILCPNCAETRKEVKKINSDIVKILRIILNQNQETLLKLKIDNETQKELNNISKNYYLYLLSSHSFKK